MLDRECESLPSLRDVLDVVDVQSRGRVAQINI
jgi:hypothetical protein